MIKDIIRVFRETWNIVNKDKIEAKKYLDVIKVESKLLVQASSRLGAIEDIIAQMYPLIPNEVRDTYAVPFIKFLRSGYKEIKRINGTSFDKKPKSIGYVEDIRTLAGVVNEIYDRANDEFKSGNYAEIKDLYDKMVGEINKVFAYYGIYRWGQWNMTTLNENEK